MAFEIIRDWYHRYLLQRAPGMGAESAAVAGQPRERFEMSTERPDAGHAAAAKRVEDEGAHLREVDPEGREASGGFPDGAAAEPSTSRPSAPEDIFRKATEFDRVDDLIEAGLFPYFKPIASQRGNRVIVDGREMLMACSNDYLGLSMDQRVKDSAKAALYNFSTSCTGSRLLNGTLTTHEELERELADFLRKEKVLTFSTGFLGCLSVISALTGRQDILYFDRENHASLYDGARLTYGTLRKYRHNDIGHLAKLLAQDVDKPGGRMVVTDGVFSMSGHLANLPEIIKVAKQYGARVLVDDAHSTGVLGANGRGTAEHFDLHDDVDLIVGTFSKAFASVGGFVAGKTEIVNYIKYVARPFIFTAALPAMQIAATRKALEIIATEPEHRYRLWKTIDMFRSGLNQLGFNTLDSKGPIVPIFVGNEETTLHFWKSVWTEGIFALPALTPSVPPGESIIRMAINANHTVEDVSQLLHTYARVGRHLEVIP